MALAHICLEQVFDSIRISGSDCHLLKANFIEIHLMVCALTAALPHLPH
jgi:hypothetical protein